MDTIDVLKTELQRAELVLSTQYSFDLAEPCYQRSLEIIAASPHERPHIIDLMESMLMDGQVSDEPIAYLMHVLRWPEIRDWAQSRLQKLEHPLAQGRPFQKILAAYSDDWENRLFYKRFSS